MLTFWSKRTAPRSIEEQVLPCCTHPTAKNCFRSAMVSGSSRLRASGLCAKLRLALEQNKNLGLSDLKPGTTVHSAKKTASLSGSSVAAASSLLRLCWLAAAFSPAHVFSQAPASSAPIAIQENQRLSATQRADEPVVYEFSAVGGRAYLIEVDQEGLDFVVSVVDPAGVERSYNSPLRRDGAEFVVLDAAHPGRHLIILNSEEFTGATGRHELQVSALPAGNGDAARVAALRLMSEAAAANSKATEQSARVALAAYTSAAELWRTDGIREYAQTLYSIAMLQYWWTYDMAQAAENAARAASLYRQLLEPSLEANALSLQAAALIESPSGSDDYRVALELLEDSYETLRRLGTSYDVGETLYRRALTKHAMGDIADAANDWTLAATSYGNSQEWSGEFRALQQLAVIDGNAGHYRSAIDRLEYIVGHLPAGKDPNLLARCLDILGTAYRELGRADDALDAFANALSVHREVGDRYHEAESLRGLGSTFYALGEYDNASKYFQQALDEQTADARTHIAALTGLGNVAFLEADYAQALSRHRAALTLTDSPLDRAYRLMLVAKDLNALGLYVESIESANEARALIEEHKGGPVNYADVLIVLGNAHIGIRQTAAAKQYLSEALAQYEALRLEGGQAEALAGLAVTLRSEGDLLTAAKNGERAIAHIERLREQVSAPTLRASFGAGYRHHYDAEIELQMDLARSSPDPDAAAHFQELALTTSERSRARMMLDLVSEASARPQQGVDEQLATRQQALKEELVELGGRRADLLSAGLEQSQGTLRELEVRMLSVETDLSVLETELRRTSSARGDLVYLDPLTADQMQREIADSQTILLQYSFGEKRSFVWVVTPKAIHGIELADRGTIEAAAARVRQKLQAFREPSGAHWASDDDLLTLSRHVLQPVAPYLDAARILVAVDGALQYIPFAVLPLETAGRTEPLIAKREVVAVPSMSVLHAQRQREWPGEPTKTVAIFADPIMERDDPRLLAQAGNPTAAVTEPTDLLMRSSFAGKQFARLPAAGEEARAIAGLVPEGLRLVLTGVDASRSRLLGADLDQYRYIHFATHGLVDARYPALSSLLLTQFDGAGHPQDGYLRQRDIYNLDLNADLVVLSACDTALGRDIRGEGLIGMTQAFMFAGARSLVVSLWKVDDAATEELMARFYEGLLADGLRPAQALRQAQLSLAQERRYGHPFFWSGFVLTGEWR
jgi:CHAT domain-containing protein